MASRGNGLKLGADGTKTHYYIGHERRTHMNTIKLLQKQWSLKSRNVGYQMKFGKVKTCKYIDSFQGFAKKKSIFSKQFLLNGQ